MSYILGHTNPERFTKLTPKQNAIIHCLQNGWQLIASSESSVVTCGCSTNEFQFSAALFWRLYRMGLIGQRTSHPQDYHLTELGVNTKTKPVKL